MIGVGMNFCVNDAPSLILSSLPNAVKSAVFRLKLQEPCYSLFTTYSLAPLKGNRTL